MSVKQILSLVALSSKRMFRDRISLVLPFILAIIMGIACRFDKAELYSGIALLGFIVGAAVLRQFWIDKSSHYYDCIKSAGAGSGVQTVAAFVDWLIITVVLSILTVIISGV